MVGAMRKMAVYLGLVEDDGYDGPGFDPDDEFEPEPEPERDRRRHQPPHQSHQSQQDEPVRMVQPPPSASQLRFRRKADDPPESPPWRPSHLNVRVWRRTPR